MKPSWPAWRRLWPRLSIQTFGAIVGSTILLHEAFFTHLDRPSLLMIGGGLLGLPVAVQIQARREPPAPPPPPARRRRAPRNEDGR